MNHQYIIFKIKFSFLNLIKVLQQIKKTKNKKITPTKNNFIDRQYSNLTHRTNYNNNVLILHTIVARSQQVIQTCV